MTTYAILGGTEWFDFATTRGTGDFMRWAQQLGAADYPLLTHLADHGWVNEIQGLDKELRKAIKAHEPDAALRKTLDDLLRTLKQRGKAESIMLTDGTSEEISDGDDEWWIDGEKVE